MASKWTNLAGTLTGFLRLGLTGVRLKNSAGSLLVRNALDSADAVVLPQSLGTGTRDGTKYLRDDGTYKPVARGGGTNGVFYENDITVTDDYTITTGKNAISAGPITIDDGVTVTVPDGSTWSVV
jgi:hypothetical protein